MFFFSYTDTENKSCTKSFSTYEEAAAFAYSHPEFKDFGWEKSPSYKGLDVAGTRTRILKARAEALFHNKSFREELAAPSVWERTGEGRSILLKNTDFVENPCSTPFYKYDEDMRVVSEEIIKKRMRSDEEKYSTASASAHTDIISVRSLSDPEAAKDAEKLHACTDEFWGDTKKEALHGPSVETAYLTYAFMGNPECSRYRNVTYTSTDCSGSEKLPRITGWDINAVMYYLNAYIFKPFNAVVGDKVLTLSPVIPAFDEKQAKRILKKRLCQGGAAVFDGDIYYREGMRLGFDSSYPYSEFSLEKGLGIKFDKLPDIESLEIERAAADVELSSFFRLPFCRSWKTLVFKDDSYREFIENPVLNGGRTYEKELPGHCYHIPYKETFYVPVMNFLFVHLFAEELGLKSDMSDTAFSREKIIPVPLMKRITEAERDRKENELKEAARRKAHAMLLEAGDKAIEAENSRLADEKKNWLEEVKKDEELLGHDRLAPEFEKEYSETLKRYVSRFGLDPLSLNRNSTAFDRILEFFLYCPTGGEDGWADLSTVPNYYLLKALAFFYFRGPRNIRRGADPYFIHGRRPECTSSLPRNLGRNTFCYLMSHLNLLFNIKTEETAEYRRLRTEAGFGEPSWQKNCGIDKFVWGLMDSALSKLDYFVLHSRDRRFEEVLNACNLSWVRSLYDKRSDDIVQPKFKADLLAVRRRTALFLMPEKASKEVYSMLKKMRRRMKVTTKKPGALNAKLKAKHNGDYDRYLLIWIDGMLLNAWNMENQIQMNENFSTTLDQYGFSGLGMNSDRNTAADWFRTVLPDWETL